MLLAPGNSIHSRRVLSWLQERGCSVLFVDAQDAEVVGDVLHVPYPCVPEQRLYNLLGWNRSFRLTNWAVGIRLRRLYRRFRPDVVHVQWVDARAYQCFYAGLRPLVLTVWGSDVNHLFRPNADVRYRRCIGEALAGADRVLADTPEMKQKCSTLAGRAVGVELLPFGIDTRRFAPRYAEAARAWRRKLNVPDGAKVFLSMRGFEARYGHHLILEAFHQALPRCQSPCVLVFKKFNQAMGLHDNALYEPQVRARIEELGIGRLVRWVDHLPYSSLPELYAFADAIVNYPEMDAFPVTFLEAAASGTPVISTGLPAYEGTFVERYFTLVEPGRIDQLADALATFVNESSEARSVAVDEARRTVVRDFDEAVVADRLLDIYKSLRKPIPVSVSA
jgi:glycosyltransferase involved in cell wall biosynthesis